MQKRLFVYGTLAPGRSNHHLLQRIPGKWEPASVRGTLTQGRWGSAMGYPGIVLDKSGNEVSGYLFSSTRLDSHWKQLDRFEGNAYLRRTVNVSRRDGRRVPAQIYALRICTAQYHRATGDTDNLVT